MSELLELPDPSLLAAPLYIAALVFEFVCIQLGRARGQFDAKDTATSLTMGVGSVLWGALFALLIQTVLWFAYQWRIATLPVTLGSVALCFVLDDLRYYWSHRFGHESRWFWASHVAHHSSTHYNLSTALRQPWTISGLFVLKIPLVLVGFHPGVVAFVFGLNLIYQFWIHTEAIGRLPRGFEAVFNTPSHHRVHHAVNPRYLDANYAGVFILWDRWFGSFVPEQDDDPVRYGLVHPLGSFNPLRVAYHEWFAIARDLLRPGLSPRERFAYAFARPGYSHDGSRRTSLQLKAEWRANRGPPDSPDLVV
jgi:sterol desaturase/sphingolipid hydroxylase (fatty acid hydroxylase superfamily)